jgi:hypothetical protein
MQLLAHHNLILATRNEFLAILPAHIRMAMCFPAKDPQQLRKGDTDICRLRILPVTKRPVRFWSSQWCFYEIGIGHYAAHHGEGLNVGGITFVQFPFNQSCGKGRYLKPVLDVLRQLQAQRPGEFSLTEAREKDATIFQRRYFISSFPNFPTSVAAKDLAWLVQKSLPKFQNIPLPP